MTTHASRPSIAATVAYERDQRGTLFAVEVVTAARWDESFLEPPDRAAADARILVLCEGGEVPDGLPGWLRVERAGLRVAEVVPAYPTVVSVTIAAALWQASPYFAGRAAPLDEFVRAAATAIRAPAPVPFEPARCERLVREYAAASALLEPFAILDAVARERWVQRRFRNPDELAVEVLFERLEAMTPEAAALLRFLRAAVVDDGTTEYLELALDRKALLEQASPWRAFEDGGLGASLSAVRAWVRRYRAAYEQHYRLVASEARDALVRLDAAQVAADALRQLNGIAALGTPMGIVALHSLSRARAALTALPSAPDPALAVTAGVTLGEPFAAIEEATRTADEVRAALEVQRRGLAARAAHLVLDRTEVPALDRLLQALTAADVDGIERILDERLASHIEELLTA